MNSSFDLKLFKTVSQLLSSFSFKNYQSACLLQSMISIRLLPGIFFCEGIISGCIGHTDFVMLNAGKTSLAHAKGASHHSSEQSSESFEILLFPIKKGQQNCKL